MKSQPATPRQRGRLSVSHRTGRPSRRIGIGVIAVAALITSACAAGQRAETAEEKPTLDGTETTIGNIELRGLAIETPLAHPFYPKGADAQVKLVLVNSGSRSDRLIGITSSAFEGWSAFTSAADAQTVQDADDPLAASSSPTATDSSDPTSTSTTGSSDSSSSSSSPSTSESSSSDSANGSSSDSNSSNSSSAGSDSTSASGSTSMTAPSSSAAPLPTGSRSVSVAPGSRVSFGTPEATGALLITKFARATYPGNSIKITFTFADNGSKTVTVPVQLTNGPNESVLPGASATGQEG